MLHPTLSQCTSRLSLKINDHEIGCRAQHLSEVIIAMATNARHRRRDGLEGRDDPFKGRSEFE
jgi:hypothetical protein